MVQQVFTAALICLGTALMLLLATSEMGTALTYPSCSQLGIVLIWFSMRYVHALECALEHMLIPDQQLLYNLALEIAAYWPAGAVRDRYAAAVHTFRIPYWDWAAVPPDGHSILPGVVWNSSSIVVDGPNGVQTIANPLFTFEFKPLNPTELPDFPVGDHIPSVAMSCK